MKLKYIMASFLIGSCAFISSCKDDFADINTNPTIVSKPDPRYLFTQALANFDGHDYFAWYYDYNNMLRWSQTVASTDVYKRQRYATSYRLFGKQQRSAFALFLPKE